MKHRRNRLRQSVAFLMVLALLAGCVPVGIMAEEAAMDETPQTTVTEEAPPTPDPTPSDETDGEAVPEPSASVSDEAVLEEEKPSEPIKAAEAEEQKEATPTPQKAEATSPDSAFDAFTVPGLTPAGTTINLFDYDPAQINLLNGQNRQFQFTDGNNRNTPINTWTGSNRVLSFMQKTLQSDGYPWIANINGFTNPGSSKSQNLQAESLGYLFNPSSWANGKTSYRNVSGLLQVDKTGYYYYDSTKNFASFDQATDHFNVYSQPAVYDIRTGSSFTPNHLGQFFPFNTAGQVFTRTANSYQPKKITSGTNTNNLNHYFGVSMTTQFVQQNSGHTRPVDEPDSQVITYDFSGDDDVWVFIDGILVGDLGGIHDKASLNINFADGSIKINGQNSGTLKSKYQAAGKENLTTWQGNTFADSTQHTLNFYYLERGGNDSNMSLKYNLVYIPQSDIIKVDQTGEPVVGAQFDLYAANYNEVTGEYTAKNNTAISHAQTEADGTVVLKDSAGKVLQLNRVQEIAGKYLIMKETYTPEGYRNNGDIWLRFEDGDNPETGSVLLSSNEWTSGTYAAAKLTTTAPNTIKLNGGGTVDLFKGGTLFSVVMKRGSVNPAEPDAFNSWYPVSGDALHGWDVSDVANNKDTIIQAARKNQNVFVMTSDGSYKTNIDHLPGDILTYRFMIAPEKHAAYDVAYFYTTASSVENATSANTTYVENNNPDHPFGYQFSTHLYVANTVDRLYVQKLDQNGVPVAVKGNLKENSATFSLYKADQITVNKETGAAQLNADAAPYQTVQTWDWDKEAGHDLTMEGVAVFNKLPEGTYYLKETDPPDGYQANPQLTEVIVDTTSQTKGVYANAGTEGDGIYVERGVGFIIKSMVQFAADSEIDAPLRNIYAVPQKSSPPVYTSEKGFQWDFKTVEGIPDIHLNYDANDILLEYGPQIPGEKTTYTTDTGWPRVDIYQCTDINHTGTPPSRQIDESLINLYSDICVVQVMNHKIGDLTINKQVTELAEGDSDTTDFSFTLTLPGQTEAVAYQTTGDVTVNGAAANGSVIPDADSKIHFTLKDKAGITFTGLKDGQVYQLTEDQINGYAPSYALDNKPDRITGTQTEMLTLDTVSGTNNTVTFYNEKSQTLALSKEVTGKYGNKTKDFKFELSFQTEAGEIPKDTALSYVKTGDNMEEPESGSLIYEEHLWKIKGKDGEENRSITLTHGQTITINGLKTGWTYVVRETNAEGYTIFYNDQPSLQEGSGTITTGENKMMVKNNNDIRPDTQFDTAGTGGMIAMAAGILAGIALVGFGVWRHYKKQRM